MLQYSALAYYTYGHQGALSAATYTVQKQCLFLTQYSIKAIHLASANMVDELQKRGSLNSAPKILYWMRSEVS